MAYERHTSTPESDMVLSVRLSERVEAYLNDLVKRRVYATKADAVRAALNSLAQIQSAKENGYRVVALPDDVLKRIGVAIEVG